MIDITKGNKYSRSVKFRLDPNCHICKEDIATIQGLMFKLRDKYGKIPIPIDKIEGLRRDAGSIVMRPDFNSAGVLTHWHIEHTTKKLNQEH